MLALLETFFQEFGYLAVFAVLVACGFGIPVPEDVTLVAGGVISGLGYTNVHLMVIVGLAGVLTGDGLIFILGRVFGDRILKFRPVARVMKPKRYAQVQHQFDKYGNRVLFVARFLPGLRTPIFLTAGMSGKIPFWRWLLMDGLAALVSVPFWVYLGSYGAENRDWLMTQVHKFQNIIFACIGLLAIWGVWYGYRRRSTLLARKNALLELRRTRRKQRRENGG